MNVNLIPVKISQRLNKLSSNDYDNIECWQHVEAFNKAQRDWVRRQLHGGNQSREGDEETKRRIDDLQILLKDKPLSSIREGNKYVTEELPSDYLEYKRLDVTAKSDNCSGKTMTSDLIPESNVNEYNNDWSLKPSFEWGETFHTLKGNKVNVYIDDFKISSTTLVYYRQPKDISLDNCETITGEELGDVDPEFKDDIVELIIDEAVSILASDIESNNQLVSSINRVTKNN